MNKKEAAVYLGCSERAINRYIAKRQLAVKYEQGKNGVQAVFDKEELDRFKATRQQPVHRPAVEHNGNHGLATRDKSGSLATVNPLTLAPIMEKLGAGVVDLVFSRMETLREKVPINERLTLTLDQASALSGLSRGFLLAAIHAKKLKAAKRGRGWNIKRADLDSYIKKL